MSSLPNQTRTIGPIVLVAVMAVAVMLIVVVAEKTVALVMEPFEIELVESSRIVREHFHLMMGWRWAVIERTKLEKLMWSWS